MNRFKKKDKVLVYCQDHLYSSSILDNKIEDGKQLYRVHYNGWKPTHDEWVPEAKVLAGIMVNCYNFLRN
jgi:hypothetical protein